MFLPAKRCPPRKFRTKIFPSKERGPAFRRSGTNGSLPLSKKQILRCVRDDYALGLGVFLRMPNFLRRGQGRSGCAKLPILLVPFTALLIEALQINFEFRLLFGC